MYTLQDLTSPLTINEWDAGHNILETAIINAFHEDMPHACLDDIPYVEYIPEDGGVEIDDEYYKLDEKLQKYLTDAQEKLQTTPLPQISLQPIEIEMTHPKEDGEKGFMGIKGE